MSNDVNQKIQHLLEREIELHQALQECLDLELQVMVQLHMPDLLEAIQTKEMLMDHIAHHENLLQNLLQQALQGSTATHHGLRSWIESQPDEQDQKKFHVLREVLIQKIQIAREKNERNAKLAQESLDRIETMKKNALGLNTNTSKENYSNHGLQNPIHEQGGRLLLTEA